MTEPAYGREGLSRKERTHGPDGKQYKSKGDDRKPAISFVIIVRSTLDLVHELLGLGTFQGQALVAAAETEVALLKNPEIVLADERKLVGRD